MLNTNNCVVAIIPARGGSKGLPGKNILKLLDKPLIAYTIEAAIQSGIFKKIIVTTDDDEIKRISIKYGAETIDRPKHLSTDTSSSLDAVEHVLAEIKKCNDVFDTFILLQPTSPLRNAKHIKDAWEQYILEKSNTLVSITKEEHTPYKLLIEKTNSISPLFGWEYLTLPRQKLPTVYRVNGAIYISKISLFLKTKNIFEQPLGYCKMEQSCSIDIDTIDDFKLVEIHLRGQNEQYSRSNN
jgi:N-acylneuraminate cytidylyltransferase/CMP-N,N'-diacetyllegionaminic acid synthase